MRRTLPVVCDSADRTAVPIDDRAGCCRPTGGANGDRRRLARQRALIVVAAVAVARRGGRAGRRRREHPPPASSGLKAHGFAGSTTGVRVYNLSTATALYERRSATQLLPASNEKLVTSSTALADWGADFHFKTELLTTGTVNAKGVYTGKIYLKGFGDPSLTTAS